MPEIISRIVEVCVFRRKEGEAEYLLLKRAENEALYPGLWHLLTGSLEGGEKPAEAAVRELEEETGLHPERIWVAPYVDVFYDADADVLNICPVFVVEVDAGRAITISSEHQSWEWFPYAQAVARLVWPGQREAVHMTREYILGNTEAGRLLELHHT